MSARHTPGPWAFSFESIDAEWSVITASGGVVIANVNADLRQGANTRLIAAAPDLLEALETLCNGIEWNIENHPTIMSESDSEALAEARAVIAKATGAPQPVIGAAVKAERDRVCDLFLMTPISFPIGINTDEEEINVSIKSDRFKLMTAVREGKPFQEVLDSIAAIKGGAA